MAATEENIRWLDMATAPRHRSILLKLEDGVAVAYWRNLAYYTRVLKQPGWQVIFFNMTDREELAIAEKTPIGWVELGQTVKKKLGITSKEIDYYKTTD